jgi:CheY-like chemotaxis protein
MLSDPSFTAFLPAKRSSPEELEASLKILKANQATTELLQSMPDFVMLLDANRQVVFANAALRRALGDDLVGKRPGELLSCRHSAETVAGCGTSPSCRHCGAAQAILGSQHGRAMTEECRITAEQGGHQEALDLRVWANPVVIEGQTFTLLSSRDIADEKRKSFLERIFLHDLMNTATALRGATAMMGAGELVVATARIGSLSSRLIDEISGQRQLIAAESNELVARPESLSSLELLRSVFASYQSPDVLNGRLLCIADDVADLSFESDPSLLGRVVGNMTKNAIEATAAGQRITLGCRLEDGKVAFWVNNPACMPEKVRLQVFNRSFSTKGAGRGLGTYSMKYLTEKYLEGDISFTSTLKDGTTFVARYPLALKSGAAAPEKSAPAVMGARLPTVVVADDEPVLRKVLTAFLQRAGVTVLAEVENGLEALEACRLHRPDVLLIDGHMPVMSGETALQLIHDELPSVMSILLTGEVDRDVIQHALTAGASGSIAKELPIPKIVESVLQQWQSRS